MQAAQAPFAARNGSAFVGFVGFVVKKWQQQTSDRPHFIACSHVRRILNCTALSPMGGTFYAMKQAKDNQMPAIERKAQAQRHRLDPRPGKVRYSWRWLGATLAGGVLASLAVATGGVPALIAVGAVGVAGAAYTLLHEPRRPRLERVTLRFPDLPLGLDGLRIGQISDMHLGMRYAAANSRWAVAHMAREQPDLLALTGDFVSYAHAIDELPTILAGLPRPPLGTYAVLGNHDHWEGVSAIQHALEPLGIVFLVNTQRRLSFGGAPLVLAGVDDLWDGVPDLRATLAGAPPGAFTIGFNGIPGLTYGIQFSIYVDEFGTGFAWKSIGEATADALGRFSFTHTPVGLSGFYRSVYPVQP